MEERRRIVELTFRKGASISEIAHENGIHPTSLSHWRSLYRSGKLADDAPRRASPATASSTTFLPVRITPEQAVSASPSLTAAHSVALSTHERAVVQITLSSGTTLRMET